MCDLIMLILDEAVLDSKGEKTVNKHNWALQY